MQPKHKVQKVADDLIYWKLFRTENVMCSFPTSGKTSSSKYMHDDLKKLRIIPLPLVQAVIPTLCGLHRSQLHQLLASGTDALRNKAVTGSHDRISVFWFLSLGQYSECADPVLGWQSPFTPPPANGSVNFNFIPEFWH